MQTEFKKKESINGIHTHFKEKKKIHKKTQE